MAQKIKIDELNIVEFFSEMDLSQDEIDKRINIANALFLFWKRVFTLFSAMQKVNDVDIDYLEEYIEFGFANEIKEYIGDFFDVADDYIDKVAKEILETTIKTKDVSDKRAKIIAETDTNAICNEIMHEEAKKSGKMRKRWVTMQDERVRHTHVMADGQEVGIDELFVVGVSDMAYPLDSSHGASASEIIRCRCVAEYF